MILDRITPEMITSVGSIQSLDATGASGLMSTTNGPGDGGLAPLAGVATLSAGAAAVAPDPATVPLAVQPGAPGALTRFGPTGDLYRTRTGRQPSGAIVYPDAAMLARLNAAATVAASPGLLGQTLEAHGVRAAAIGDADLPGDPLRQAPILAMDQTGSVPFGGFGTNLSQPEQASPVAVNEQAMEAAFTSALASARFIVVDWGDTSRIDRLLQRAGSRLAQLDARGLSLRQRLDGQRTGSLQRLDTFLQFLQSKLRLTRDIVVIVSPSPPSEDQQRGVNLAPIVVSGGGLPTGRLTSDTTHRVGVVSNADLAPSILSWFGIATPGSMTGHPFGAKTADFPLSATIASFRRLSQVANQRTPILAAALLLWVVSVGLSLAVLERRIRALQRTPGDGGGEARRRPAGRVGDRRVGDRRRRKPGSPDGWLTAARVLLPAAAFLPLALLLQPLVPAGRTPVAIIEVIGAAVAAGAVAASAAQRRSVTALGAAGVLTILAMLGDASTGSTLAGDSPGGANVAGGAASSHLGAIMGGAAVAAAVLAVGALTQRTRRRPGPRRAGSILAMAGLAALVPTPLGGVAVAATAGIPAVATEAALAEPTPPSRKARIAVGAAVMAGLILAGVVVAAGALDRSRAIPGASAAPADLAAIVLAATARWLRMIVASGWTFGLVASVATLVFLERRTARTKVAPRGRGLQPPDRFAGGALTALLVGAVLAMVTSVSGAISAATILMAAVVLATASSLDRTLVRP